MAQKIIDKIIDEVNKLILSGVRGRDVPEIVLWQLVNSFDAEYGAYYIAKNFKDEFKCRIAVDKSGNTDNKGYVNQGVFLSDSYMECLEKGIIAKDIYNKERFSWQDINIAAEEFRSKLIETTTSDKDNILNSWEESKEKRKKINDIRARIAPQVPPSETGKDVIIGDNQITIPVIFSVLLEAETLISYVSAVVTLYSEDSKKFLKYKNKKISLERLCNLLSIFFKFNQRIQDEKRWTVINQNLMKSATGNFKATFKNILKSLKKLRLTFASYWAYFETSDESNVKRKFWVKKSSKKYGKKEDKEDEDEDEDELDEDEPLITEENEDVVLTWYTNKLREKLKKAPCDTFVYEYFIGDKKEFDEGKYKLRNPGLFDDNNAEKLYLIPIIRPKEKADYKVHNNSDIEIHGFMFLLPHKNIKNLLFYNKEALHELSLNISRIVDDAKKIAMNMITESIREESENYLGDFRRFLRKIIEIIKNYVTIDGCSIFFYNELYKRLELCETTGIEDREGNKIKDYEKVFYSDDDSQSKTWTVYKDEAGKNLTVFDNVDKDSYKYKEAISIASKNRKFSTLIIPIRSGTDRDKTLGVVRFTNLKSWLNKEIVIPYPDDFVALLEHVAHLLGLYYLSYAHYNKLLHIFGSSPYRVGKNRWSKCKPPFICNGGKSFYSLKNLS